MKRDERSRSIADILKDPEVQELVTRLITNEYPEEEVDQLKLEFARAVAYIERHGLPNLHSIAVTAWARGFDTGFGAAINVANEAWDY